ncbi:uncharacterized protein LOC128556922 [Mercenaria mercenaria]|uniref:uncharacterized protein LOC128556922 n=1 Tax=Mercenaria mercenaria TaxID=6596 RepID=UPI00234E6BBC|nr:uncharacterized protein LOC128556922 [Mercenaria mercenaria]
MQTNKNSTWILCFALLCISQLTVGTSVATSTEPTAGQDTCKVSLKEHQGDSDISPSIPKSHVALLLLLGFGGFSLVIAGGYKSIRKYIFKDDQQLDTVFDAGGRVSFSLTAVTVTSQLLWPADFLQSSTLTSKSGLGGSLWMAIGIVIDILLFPTLSLYLKTRAPGAKTFPQIAYARFGKAAHILFCILALLANLITTTSMLLAGKSTLKVLGKDTNNEFIFLILAVLFGSYCMIGGLGTTFYISYFNTALTFITVTVFVLYTSYYPSDDMKDVSSMEALYNAASCLEAPEGNYGNSFLTFRTSSGVIYGVVLMFMATSISFCDQANWQSRIAAKPTQGVLGFFLAAYMWFVIPTALSFTATMTYFSLSAQNGSHILTGAEIDNGYITPYVMNDLLGQTGGYLLLTMLMMSLMSTGSGEVMAVSSIIVYDIYKTYINPFRKGLTPTGCILCGKEKLLDLCRDHSNLCQCPTSIDCKACELDISNRATQGIDNVQYACTVHGRYRQYEDGLMRYKSWCMVWVVVCIVPYGLLVSETGMNVNWATLGTQVLTSPFLWPLFLTITWSKATSQGVIAGGIIGTACSITGMLVMGSTYEDGLSNFYVNTAESYSLLTAMVSGFVVSCVVSVGVSLCTHKINSEADVEREWAKTINIDNPLNPFRQVYEEELKEVDAGTLITAKTMDTVFRKARIYAAVGGVISLIIFLVIIPAIALSFEVLNFDQFSTWMKTFQIYCFICTFIVVVLPPVEECLQIWRRFKRNESASTEHKDPKSSVGNVSNLLHSEKL